MTRIIAGTAGGRRLVVPPGRGTRPTSDRAREGIFLTLDSLQGLAGARVIDLYAGSGAVGLEALSRGAAHALLVEADPKAVRTIRANIQALGLDGAQVVAEKVERLLGRPAEVSRPRQGGRDAGGDQCHSEAREPYDIVFADPPYAVTGEEVTRVLESLRDNGWLAEGALVAFERETRGKPLVWPEGYVEERVRRYGEASVWYGRAAGNP
ncbi:RsmD family RNA methyltransferase [Nonomuraea sp. NPDC048916]|uniref:RsmD family RNA methyltransferase n=1 Tax=Nonomuraea sp. NPDC048916 TaxID=3154232 RepID=UPI0033D99610